ncbi:MAG: S1C family serine protease [Candidatus Bipolaricaulia bacterium]
MPRRYIALSLLILITAVGVAWWAGTQTAMESGLPSNAATANQEPSTTSTTQTDDPSTTSGQDQLRPSQSGGLLPWEQRATQVYQDAQPAVVNITSTVVTQSFRGERAREGTGSGFVYDKQGRIITNYHVVQNASQIEVTFPGGNIATAEMIGTDPINDLAVIDVDVPKDQLHPVEMGNSDQLVPGQMAIAIGNPFGQFERTATMGVVSALDRTLRRGNGQPPIFGLIQTDAAINRGNSGGPLLNSQGRVIGVTTAIFSPSGGSVGIGFAVPSNTVSQEVPVLIEKGRYPHPWLGISAPSYPLTPELAQRLREAGITIGTDHGVMVYKVTPGGPADQAGIQGADRLAVVGNRQVPLGGDIITAIDGTQVSSIADLMGYLQTETEVGQTVTLTIVRDGQEQTVEVTLGRRPVGR